MKQTAILLIISIMLPATALAETGHQADLNMVIDFGAIFSELGPLLEAEGPDPDEGEMPEMESEMMLHGQMYWTGEFMRLDFDPMEGARESTIVEIDNQVSYKLDHVAKTAMRIDTRDFSAELATGLDMPDPEALASNWDAMLESMEAMEGAVVNELAPRKISGYDCKGFSFVVPMSEFSDTPEDETLSEENQALADMMGAMMSVMGGYSGEIWVAEGLTMPISMTLNTMMMNYSWGLSNIIEADIDPGMFKIPGDYEIVEMKLPDMSGMPDFSESPEPAPSGGAE